MVHNGIEVSSFVSSSLSALTDDYRSTVRRHATHH
jgi:hypothetical protein